MLSSGSSAPVRLAVELVERAGVGPGEHHPRERAQERRRHERGHDEVLDEPRARQVGARHEPRQRRPDGERDARPTQNDSTSVFQSAARSAGIAERARVVRERRRRLAAARSTADEPAQRQRDQHHQRQRGHDPDGRASIGRTSDVASRRAVRRADHAPKNSTKRLRISSLRFSSSSGSTCRSFSSPSLGLSVGYFTSGWPV